MLQIKNTLGGGKSNAPYAWAKYEVMPDEILTNPSIDLSYVQSSGRINITGASFDLSFLPSVTNSSGLSPNGTDNEKQVVNFFTGFQFATNQYNLDLYNDVLTFYFGAGALAITEFHNDTDGTWFTVAVIGTHSSFEKTLTFTGEKIGRRSYHNFIEYITDKSLTKYPNGEVHTDGYFYRYAPEGLYAWKKLSAQGGDFIDYVVSDKETAYPDGGEKGGYWYERVGDVKIATGTLSVSRKTSLTIEHGLSVKPTKFILWATYLNDEDYQNGAYFSVDNDNIKAGYTPLNDGVIIEADGAKETTINDIKIIISRIKGSKYNNNYFYWNGNYNWIAIAE